MWVGVSLVKFGEFYIYKECESRKNERGFYGKEGRWKRVMGIKMIKIYCIYV